MSGVLVWKRSFEGVIADVYVASVPVGRSLSICDFCMYAPPSSFDGKPCTMCPAQLREDFYVDE